jgi:uncharacterized protein YebE (UPF0316 family)
MKQAYLKPNFSKEEQNQTKSSWALKINYARLKKTNYLFLLALTMLFASSCSDDNEKGDTLYSNGAFILNEGNYQRSNASVSFLNFNSDSVTNNIFYKSNNRPLGDVLQSMVIYKEKAYLVLNNSNKIEVVNVDDFKQTGTLENLSQPRYLTFYNNKGYLTQWGTVTSIAGNVAVFDAPTLTIDTIIPLGNGPEGIVVLNNKIWIANGGGLGIDSTITVIDPATNCIIKNIVVGYNPQNFTIDNENQLWVLCYGVSDWTNSNNDKSSQLVRINPNDYSIVLRIEIGKNSHPSILCSNKAKSILYYGGGFNLSGIWKMNVKATSVESKPFIDGLFYGFSVNPENDEIYAFDAKDYATAGDLIRYSSSGSKIKSYTVGMIPKSAVFK